MKIKSLIDTILQSIATGTASDVEINDRTFFSELMDGRPGSPHKHAYDMRPLKPVWRKDRRFPVMSWLWSLLLCVITSVITAFYWLSSAVYRLFTGRRRDLQHSRRFNAALLFSAILVSLVLLVYAVVFFIKDVLLFDESMYSNKNGALVVEQPCSVEQYTFLFNSATQWYDSGIELVKGEVFEISYSGSFYGAIADMNSAAIENRKLKYARTLSTFNYHSDKVIESDKGDGPENILPEMPFGTLLYQIRTDTEENKYRNPDQVKDKSGDSLGRIIWPVYKRNRIYKARAKRSGTLRFAVNDNYIEPTEATEPPEATEPTDTSKSAEVPNPTDTTKSTEGRELTQAMVFDDNVGELLVNVRVYRNTGVNLYKRAFRRLDSDNSMLLVLIVLGGACVLLVCDWSLGKLLRKTRYPIAK